MLSNLFLAIIWILLSVIHGILGAIPVTVPADVATSINQFGGYLAYASGYIDLAGVFGAFSFLLNFLVGWFTFKLLLMLYHMVVARQVHDSHALPAQQKTGK